MELMGGSIEVESEEWKGTTFSVLLPIRKDVEVTSRLRVARWEGEQGGVISTSEDVLENGDEMTPFFFSHGGIGGSHGEID